MILINFKVLPKVDVPEAVGALLWPLGITEVFSLSGELDQTLTGMYGNYNCVLLSFILT